MGWAGSLAERTARLAAQRAARGLRRALDGRRRRLLQALRALVRLAQPAELTASCTASCTLSTASRAEMFSCRRGGVAGLRGRGHHGREAGGPGLVERFDTEFNTDFSAKSPNFRGLVLFCIEADFCAQIRIFQHFLTRRLKVSQQFSRTIRFAILCTAPISKFEQIVVKCFRNFVQISAKTR